MVSLSKTGRASSDKISTAVRQFIFRKKLSNLDFKSYEKYWDESYENDLKTLNENMQKKSIKSAITKILKIWNEVYKLYSKSNPKIGIKDFYNSLCEKDKSELENLYNQLTKDEISDILQVSSDIKYYIGEQKLDTPDIDKIVSCGDFLSKFIDEFPFADDLNEEDKDDESNESNELTENNSLSGPIKLKLKENKRNKYKNKFSIYLHNDIDELLKEFEPYSIDNMCTKKKLRHVATIISLMRSKYGSSQNLKNILKELETLINEFAKENSSTLEMIERSFISGSDVDRSKLDFIENFESIINYGIVKLKNHTNENSTNENNGYQECIKILSKFIRNKKDDKINRESINEKEMYAAEGLKTIEEIRKRISVINKAINKHTIGISKNRNDNINFEEENELYNNNKKLQEYYEAFQKMSPEEIYVDADIGKTNNNRKKRNNNGKINIHKVPAKVLCPLAKDIFTIVEKIEKYLKIDSKDYDDDTSSKKGANLYYSDKNFIKLQQQEFSNIKNDNEKCIHKYKAARLMCRAFGVILFNIESDDEGLKKLREKYSDTTDSSISESHKLYNITLKRNTNNFGKYSDDVKNIIFNDIVKDINYVSNLDFQESIKRRLKLFSELNENTIGNIEPNNWIGMPKKFVDYIGQILLQVSQKSISSSNLLEKNKAQLDRIFINNT